MSMSTELMQAFADIGAELQIETRGQGVTIDLRRLADREVFLLRQPSLRPITAEAIDVRPHRRHLVLDVYGDWLAVSGRFLCGHDERHWFVASVPFGRATQHVSGAMETLKPLLVRREQKRKGVTHRRHRRQTQAYVRQGEWFFLPRPRMHVDFEHVERNGRLARAGGKPHQVEWLYVMDDTLKFARGRVSHADHSTLHLDVWHRVVQNNEPEPQQLQRRPALQVAFVD
jgi:hypothetical protein